MGSESGFKVDLEALAAHEPEVRRVADRVQQAIDATGEAQAALDFNAFGIVGQLFAAPIQIWISSATSFISDLGQAGHELADKVKTAHEALSTHEENTKSALSAIGREIPE